MHPPYVVIQKKRGETPLGAIETWKQAHPSYASLPASYAGRLDPMAEGKLMVLLGDECKKQKRYTKLDKEYEIEVLLDLATDTGDVLGLPTYSGQETSPDRQRLRRFLRAVSGRHRVPYPSFSSKPVNGKPLFLYALEGTLDTIQIPVHEEVIYTAKLISLDTLPKQQVEKHITDSLSHVPRSDEPSKALGADFRQDVIRAGWRTLFEAMPERSFTVLRLRVACASGTYMRSLAERIGSELQTPALALSIKRTRIGKYRKVGPFRFWAKTY
jgi:tRNA pseudouridine55 synthase